MSKLTLTFNDDGTVDTSLDRDTKTEILLTGLVTTLVGFIKEVSGNYETEDKHLNDAIASLKKKG